MLVASSDLQYYGASKIRGVVAKTLGFLKSRVQGLHILTGPYFFFCKIVVRGQNQEQFVAKMAVMQQTLTRPASADEADE